MSVNASGWTPRAPEATEGEAQTWTGNRALMLEEALIFEMDCEKGSGVDLEPSGAASALPDGLLRNRPIGLPGLSEPETVRHYTRLSRQNYAIDLGLFRSARAR
jgi:glycine dehydrogenase subunit 2